jgi:SPW repeat
MDDWKSGLDWVNVVLGVVLMMWGVVPTGGIVWNVLLAGVAIALVAIWSLSSPETTTPEWANVMLGIWVVVAPLLLGYAGTPNAAVSRLVGPCVVAIAAWRAWTIQTSRVGSPQRQPQPTGLPRCVRQEVPQPWASGACRPSRSGRRPIASACWRARPRTDRIG